METEAADGSDLGKWLRATHETLKLHVDVVCLPVEASIVAADAARDGLAQWKVTVASKALPLQYKVFLEEYAQLREAYELHQEVGNGYMRQFLELQEKETKSAEAHKSYLRGQKVKFVQRLKSRGCADAICSVLGWALANVPDGRLQDGFSEMDLEFRPADMADPESVKNMFELVRTFMAGCEKPVVKAEPVEDGALDGDLDGWPSFWHQELGRMFDVYGDAASTQAAQSILQVCAGGGISGTTTVPLGESDSFQAQPVGMGTFDFGEVGNFSTKRLLVHMSLIGKMDLRVNAWQWMGLPIFITAVSGVIGVVSLSAKNCQAAGSDVARYLESLPSGELAKNNSFVLGPGQSAWFPWGTCPVIVPIASQQEMDDPSLFKDLRTGARRQLPPTMASNHAAYFVHLVLDRGAALHAHKDSAHIASRLVEAWPHIPPSCAEDAALEAMKALLLDKKVASPMPSKLPRQPGQ